MCVISQQWKRRNLPNISLNPIEELLGSGSTLNVKAKNGTDIPYSGWVEVNFQLISDGDNDTTLKVPMLVSSIDAHGSDHPIIGYNVIELICREYSGQ